MSFLHDPPHHRRERLIGQKVPGQEERSLKAALLQGIQDRLAAFAEGMPGKDQRDFLFRLRSANDPAIAELKTRVRDGRQVGRADKAGQQHKKCQEDFHRSNFALAAGFFNFEVRVIGKRKCQKKTLLVLRDFASDFRNHVSRQVIETG
jgi:hypothetical protein